MFCVISASMRSVAVPSEYWLKFTLSMRTTPSLVQVSLVALTTSPCPSSE